MPIKILPFCIATALILLITACSDSGQGNTPITNTNPEKETTSEGKAVVEKSDHTDVDIQNLIKVTEQLKQHADELGYEWNTIAPLIEQGHKALNGGHQKHAITLFQEAKKQSELAISQARYADENWHLLMPKNN